MQVWPWNDGGHHINVEYLHPALLNGCMQSGTTVCHTRKTPHGEWLQLVPGRPFDCATAYIAILWNEHQFSPKKFKGLKHSRIIIKSS